MSDRHVVPAENGWQVEKENAQRPSAKAPTQAEAIKRAVEIVANDGGGQVVVHGADGTVRETRTVEAGSETTGAEAAATAVTAGAKGAQATAEKVADAVTDTASTIGDDVEDTARSVAATARDTAEDVAGDLSEATDDVADEVTAATRRARAEIRETAEQAGDALVTGTDRAAEVGDDVGDRLVTASDRTGRYIHRVTEQAASPIDSVARALNPVRVAGRTAGAVIAGALYVGGVVAQRGTRTASRGARTLTGRR